MPPRKTKPEATQTPQEALEPNQADSTALVATEPDASSGSIYLQKFNSLFPTLSKGSQDAITTLQGKFSSNKRGLHADSNSNGPSFRPVIIKIRQPTTQSAPDITKMGDLFTTTNEVLGKEFKVIPLSFWRERVKWPEGSTTSDNPQCKSIDGTMGLWERTKWLECAVCPHRKWTVKDGRGFFPCKESINLLAIDEALSNFYRIQFVGSNITVGKKFYSLIRTRPEIFDSVWTIGTQKNPKYPTYVYTIPTIDKTFTPQDELYKISDTFLDMIEEMRVQREELQKKFMATSSGMASDALDTLMSNDSEDDAAPSDFSM